MGKKASVEEDKSHSTMAEPGLWNKFMQYMTSPVDPSNLGVVRILFGKAVAVFFLPLFI